MVFDPRCLATRPGAIIRASRIQPAAPAPESLEPAPKAVNLLESLHERTDVPDMPVGAGPARMPLASPRIIRALGALTRASDPPAPHRARRLLLLLLGVWLVNLFDLGFTLVATEQRLMTELNPVARLVMNWGTGAVVIYKLLLLIVGSAVLWWQRHRLLTELVLWGYAVVCVGLAVHWQNLYHAAEPLWIEAGTIQEILPPNASYRFSSISPPAADSDGRAEAHGTQGAPPDAGLDPLKHADAHETPQQHPLPPDGRPPPDRRPQPGPDE